MMVLWINFCFVLSDFFLFNFFYKCLRKKFHLIPNVSELIALRKERFRGVDEEEFDSYLVLKFPFFLSNLRG